MTKKVLLLRAPDEDGRDRYEAAFEARGWVATSVPVLETVLHVDALRARIERGPEGLLGVIVTSKRAVEAWCAATDKTQAAWRAVPFYVVGAATADAVCGAGLAADVRGGAEAGTGERLAAFILGEEASRGRRMLCLTGDKNRETLPTMLADGGVALETLQVYATAGSAAAAVAAVAAGEWGWVVHFAPSAARAVVAALGGTAARVAAIGPTTAGVLRDELGVFVHAVAARPTPESLCSAVLNCA